MRILITGGAGFIGSNLARHALANNHSVRIIDDFSTGRRDNIAELEADVSENSILDRNALLRAMKGIDSVVHLAAIPSVPRSVANPRSSHEANITGTLNVLEAARTAGVSHFSCSSSSSVYGANPKLPKTETDYTIPLSPYAVSKQATEGYALAYQHSYGIPTLAFRFFNVYGPGQAADHDYAAVIPKFLHAALREQPVTLHGDGTQSRDFTFVDTVCTVLLRAAERTIVKPEPLNLAFQTNTTLLHLLKMLEDQLGRPIPRLHTEPRIGDVQASQADSTRLRKIFPEIQPVPLRQGLEATATWMQEKIR